MSCFVFSAGSLLHFDDPLLKLEDCYFIDPEWLSQMVAQVFTVGNINPFVDDQGVLKRTDVPLLFKGETLPEDFIDNYLRYGNQGIELCYQSFAINFDQDKRMVKGRA